MRVISGRLGGRQFDSPKSVKTHPMSDKIRGALFNILGDIEGLTVLDPFAGTGALSFEAISRGAASAVVIDNDRDAQKTIATNIHLLGLRPGVKLVCATANAWLQTSDDETFDLVLCDPPYGNLQLNLLQRLGARLNKNGIFVLSYPVGAEAPELTGLKQIERRSYGDAQLIFYTAA